jgi:DNA-3-methyladenine glycosylase
MTLPASFFLRPTLEVLDDLIGTVLVRRSKEGLTSGIIVEAEAYRGEDDPASFAFIGRTKRSEMLYRQPGKAFVYLTYGIHYLLNIITEREGFPAAILIRAIEPLEGISLMKKRRKGEDLFNLCSGPAKVCQALGIDLAMNDRMVTSSRSPLFIKERDKRDRGHTELVRRPRIGISEGKDRLWRVYLKGSPYISSP